ncbi:MAG: ATP-binding protein [Chromatiaceae bacterium]|nr:ATP-binding protein [Chromatiaceae bacterium]
MKVPKRIAKALIDSLKAGVVPRIGLENVLVGRSAEINALLDDIETVKEGGASFRFIVGNYGSGKSFMLQIMKNYAMDKGFVIVDADMSPERRLAGTGGQGVATYKELIRNMSTKTKSEGGALQLVIEKWISKIKMEVFRESGLEECDPLFNKKVEYKITETIQEIDELVHGFEFGQNIRTYWKAYNDGDEYKMQLVVKWLRGEYTTKTEAREELGVRVIIDDSSWYDYLKVMALFIVKAGFGGLMVMIDETVNLYKISHAVSRNNNYEKLLTIFNDTMQGKAKYIGFILGGTPQSITDSRRGVYSYEALQSRLVSGKYVVEGYKDFLSPIINLAALTPEELVVLTEKLKEIHEAYLGYESRITQDDRIYFIKCELSRVGAQSKVTPREIIRDYIEVLNITMQIPDTSIADIIGKPDFVFSTNEVTEEVIHETYEEFKL